MNQPSNLSTSLPLPLPFTPHFPSSSSDDRYLTYESSTGSTLVSPPYSCHLDTKRIAYVPRIILYTPYSSRHRSIEAKHHLLLNPRTTIRPLSSRSPLFQSLSSLYPVPIQSPFRRKLARVLAAQTLDNPTLPGAARF